jgi:hypothetical protein
LLLRELRNRVRRTLVSYRDAGFGDNLLAAANAWYYAKLTQRDLMVIWSPSRYLSDKRRNAFNAFFSLPDHIEGVPILTPDCVDRVSGFVLSNIDGFLLPLLPHPIFAVLYLLYSAAGQIRLKRLSAILGSGISGARIGRRRELESIITLGKDIRRKVVITNGCYEPHERLHPFFDALQLAPELRSPADEFATAHFQSKRVIGVHVRYYDQSLPRSDHTDFWLDPEKALQVCEEKITEAIRRLSSSGGNTAGECERLARKEKGEDPSDKLSPSDYVIFLATDSVRVHDAVKRRFENVVRYEKSFGSEGARELHDELPVETASASAIEMFLLAKSNILVRYPPGSWFSNYASLYVKEIIV